MFQFLQNCWFFTWELFKFMIFFYPIWLPGFIVAGLLTCRFEYQAWTSIVANTRASLPGLIRAVGVGILGSVGREASVNAMLALLKGGVPPSTTFAYLIASRNLTIHFWSVFTLSLGAEFATGQALGALVMVLAVTPVIHRLVSRSVAGSTSESLGAGDPSSEHSQSLRWRTLLLSPTGWWTVLKFMGRESGRLAPSLALGILFAGIIFAAGLQPWWPRFADIFGHATFLSDLANAFVGAALSFVLSLSPVGNIPVVHALFKTDGLGYPGIISFCLASVIHRKDIKAYASAFKQGKRVWLLAGLLYAGAVLGGLGSTWIYAAFDFRPSLPPIKLAGKLLEAFLNYLKH